MAAGLGLEPSHPVLETSALANILTRNMYKFSYSSVRNAKRLSALSVKICGIGEYLVGIVGFEPTLEGF